MSEIDPGQEPEVPPTITMPDTKPDSASVAEPTAEQPVVPNENDGKTRKRGPRYWWRRLRGQDGALPSEEVGNVAGPETVQPDNLIFVEEEDYNRSDVREELDALFDNNNEVVTGEVARAPFVRLQQILQRFGFDNNEQPEPDIPEKQRQPRLSKDLIIGMLINGNKTRIKAEKLIDALNEFDDYKNLGDSEVDRGLKGLFRDSAIAMIDFLDNSEARVIFSNEAGDIVDACNGLFTEAEFAQLKDNIISGNLNDDQKAQLDTILSVGVPGVEVPEEARERLTRLVEGKTKVINADTESIAKQIASLTIKDTGLDGKAKDVLMKAISGDMDSYEDAQRLLEKALEKVPENTETSEDVKSKIESLQSTLTERGQKDAEVLEEALADFMEGIDIKDGEVVVDEFDNKAAGAETAESAQSRLSQMNEKLTKIIPKMGDWLTSPGLRSSLEIGGIGLLALLLMVMKMTLEQQLAAR